MAQTSAACDASRCASTHFHTCIAPRSFFVFDRLIDTFLIADLALNFFTGTVSTTGRVSLHRQSIVWEYLTGWFTLDLVSSIPYEIIMMIAFNDQVPGWGQPVLAESFTIG